VTRECLWVRRGWGGNCAGFRKTPL
jgi:hypothetical protein